MKRMSRQLEQIEKFLVEQILSGNYAVGTNLPGERELAARLGVTRANVRIVLQKMAAAGWLKVNERHATQVNDYWREGNLYVLAAIVQHAQAGGADVLLFVDELLEVRQGIAPFYTRRAVERQPREIAGLLKSAPDKPAPGELAAFDWQVHLTMARLSGNKVYPLLLNSFAVLGQQMGQFYFQYTPCRQATLCFYNRLREAALRQDGPAAFHCTEVAMQESRQLWRRCLADFEDASVKEVGSDGKALEWLG